MGQTEDTLQKMNERLERLETALCWLETRQELSELMGRYAFYITAGQGETLLRELWSARDDVSIEYGASGVYESLWKVKTFYYKDAVPGRLTTLSLSSPTIRVAEDARTAHGRWMAFSTESDAGDLAEKPPLETDSRRFLLSSETKEKKRYRAEVLLQRYYVDFIREECGWRILHLRVAELFRCPYDRDWVRYATERFETDGMWLESLFETSMELPPESHGENLPSRETTRHWQYTQNGLQEQMEEECH